MMSGLRALLGETLKAMGERLGAGPSFSAGERACVVLVDQSGALKAMSGPARAAFRAHGAARNLSMLFLPEDRAAIDAAIAAPAIGRLRVRARAADGQIGSYELTFQRRNNRHIAVLVTDRSDEEATKRALEKEVSTASAEARASARMLADLSHEMKTPLNAVIGFADAMREETFGPIGNEKYEEYAGHIGASGRHLLDLVTSILDLARLEADRLALKPVICAPADIIRECTEMVRLAAQEAGLSLNLEVDDAIGECLLDPRALRQIVINLLSNAVKFTSDGAITVRARIVDEALVLAVDDTGIGMSDDELAALGERFTSAQGPGVRGADGAGLGLSLAFALAERHGGGLDITSAPGEGLTATVCLPLVRARAHENTPVTTSHTIKHDQPTDLNDPHIQTQLERVEAYRREVAAGRALADNANAA